MTTRQVQFSAENQPLIPNSYQPSGKKRWLFTAVVSAAGTGGVGYVAVKSFISGTFVNGGILTAGSLICAGACAYCCYRFVMALTTRDIEPVVLTTNVEANKANDLMLLTIHNRLNRLLDQTAMVDLEENIDQVKLYDSISQQLTQLEQMLPELQRDFIELQELIPGFSNKSFGSPSTGSLFDSPSADVSLDGGLFTKIDGLSKRMAQRLSRNGSRSQSANNSAYNSPMVIRTTSTVPLSSSTEKPNVPQLKFNKIINDTSDNESDKEGEK
jgi:hypothetical protein